MMLPNDGRRPEPVTAEKAAERLRRAPSTIRYWVTHYNARRLGKHGRKMYYDYNDLYVIEREIYHEHDVPATWQERAKIRERCPLKTAGSFPAAA
jgi:hypothetical protein